MKNNISFNSNLSKFGIGLFETIKVVNRKPEFIDMHINRMLSSAKELDIDIEYSKEDLINFINEYIINENIVTKAVRITIFDEGYNISYRDIIYNDDLYKKGYRLNISPIRRGDSIIYRHKTSNYFENIYTKQYANSKGFDDGIFINTDDTVLECSMSNIFFIKDKVVYTPRSTLPILNGIMKKRVITLCEELSIKLVEYDIKVTDLEEFDFCFISNSLMGILKIKQIENITYKRDNDIFNYLWRNLKCQC